MQASQTPLDPPTAPQAAPDTSTSTSVLEREETRADEQLWEPGDHERFAHYVRKEKIVESAVTGTPVVALCGKVWVPGRNPDRFPVCPMCKEIYESVGQTGGGGEDRD